MINSVFSPQLQIRPLLIHTFSQLAAHLASRLSSFAAQSTRELVSRRGSASHAFLILFSMKIESHKRRINPNLNKHMLVKSQDCFELNNKWKCWNFSLSNNHEKKHDLGNQLRFNNNLWMIIYVHNNTWMMIYVHNNLWMIIHVNNYLLMIIYVHNNLGMMIWEW